MSVLATKMKNNGSFINANYYSGKVGHNLTKLPPIPRFRTKGQCNLSEKELVNKMYDLAQRDAAAGTDSMYNNNCERSGEFCKLLDDFISLASPDREGIVKNTLKDLTGQSGIFNLSKQDLELSFFKLLFNGSDKSKKTIDNISFRDGQGNEVAYYSRLNGWSSNVPTPAECEQSEKFFRIWKQAITIAQAEVDIKAKQQSTESGEESDQLPNKEIEMSFLV